MRKLTKELRTRLAEANLIIKDLDTSIEEIQEAIQAEDLEYISDTMDSFIQEFDKLKLLLKD